MQVTNWKEPIELSNRNHKITEKIKIILVVFRATFFNVEVFSVGRMHKKRIPTKGSTNKITNIEELKKKRTLKKNILNSLIIKFVFLVIIIYKLKRLQICR